MDVSIASRKPDFAALYPNRESFDAAINAEGMIAGLMKSHIDQLPISAHGKKFSLSDPATLSIQEGTGVDSFSARRFNDYLLTKMGGKIVPGASGRIENMLLTVPTQRTPWSVSKSFTDRLERHYMSLIRGLGNNRKYTIVCHPNNKLRIENWFSDIDDIAIDFALSPRFGYSIWAQDAYVCIQHHSGKGMLLEGVCFPRFEDMTIADDVAYQTDISVFQSYMYFQGGNVIGGERETLIGKDYVLRNTGRAGVEYEADVVSAFTKLFGTDVRVLGGQKSASYDWLRKGVLSGYGQQPLFHIDMYVTPTGVVGPSGKEIVFLGRPSKAKEIVGHYSEVAQFDNSQIDEFFSETEEQLGDSYEVRHLPLLLTYGDLNGAEKRKDFYFLSFNNVVLEAYYDNGEFVRKVIMPTYSGDSSEYGTSRKTREDLENAAETEWRRAGFEVHRMDGLEDLAHGLGSVHCITKALQRTTSVPA